MPHISYTQHMHAATVGTMITKIARKECQKKWNERTGKPFESCVRCVFLCAFVVSMCVCGCRCHSHNYLCCYSSWSQTARIECVSIHNTAQNSIITLKPTNKYKHTETTFFFAGSNNRAENNVIIIKDHFRRCSVCVGLFTYFHCLKSISDYSFISSVFFLILFSLSLAILNKVLRFFPAIWQTYTVWKKRRVHRHISFSLCVSVCRIWLLSI